MTHASAQERPGDTCDPGGWRVALRARVPFTHRAGAHLKTQEQDKLEKSKDVLRDLYQRPATGRTTALGRRVEKPGEKSPGGPSGQTAGVDDQKRHTNK